MNHISPYLFLSREDDDDVRDIGKYDFRFVLLHLCYLMLTSPYMPPMNDALAKQEFSWKLNQSNPNPTSFQEIIATNVHLPYLVCLKRK